MRRPLKILIILAIILVTVIVAAIIAMQIIERNLENLASLPVQQIDLATLADGTYEGSFSSFPVSAEVEVAIKNQKITDITIIKHEHGQGSEAEDLPEEVIREQSLQVDAVTGATYSSKVILKAIENALTSTE
ncbi:MAG: FMN-binding protein [Spirochaetota bacterium]